jgi:hypothetical protein
MKVERKIYKGIEYVLVAELPLLQREQLLQTLSKDHFIKILIDGAIVSQCLQYKEYSLWFDNVFASKAQSVKEIVTEKVSLPAPRLALNKA